VEIAKGAPGIAPRNALLSLHLRRHPRPRHRGYVADAKKAVGGEDQVPAGLLHALERQFEYMERAHPEDEGGHPGHAADHLPAALSHFRRLTETSSSCFGAFALVGRPFWLMWLLNTTFGRASPRSRRFIALAACRRKPDG